MVKKCSKCKQWRLFTEFYKEKKGFLGLQNYCKSCRCSPAYKKQRQIYYNKNKKKILRKHKQYRSRPEFKILRRQIEKEYKKNNPWVRHWYYAYNRCNNKTHRKYKFYGGRGIKLLLSIRQIRYLWFRDRSDILGRPSIDRINPDEHYTLENCRFIELAENLRMARNRT